MVRCRGSAVRRPAVNSGRLWSRPAARPSTPSTATRGAANSIASGKPSSLRHVLTTNGAFASVSAKSSTTAVTRSTNNWTAGKAAASPAVSVADASGLPSGPRRYWRSPKTPSGSRLVATILMSEVPLSTAAASVATASITCSQLSSSSSIRLFLSAATRVGSGSSVPISKPSKVAIAVGTRRGSASDARSTSQTPCSWLAMTRSATARATVVLPMPPPARSTRGAKMSKARLPSRTGLSPSSKSRCAASSRYGPNTTARSPPAVGSGSVATDIAQFVQQLFRCNQVGGAETFGEAVVDRPEADNGVGLAALTAQQARKAGHGTQLPGQGLLPAPLVQGPPEEILYRFHGHRGRLPEQEFPLEAQQ